MKIDLERLEPKLDLEGKYVDFSLLRLALSVYTVVKNEKELEISKPTGAGECRGVCPKCGNTKSFTLNVKTNRFNCFNKACSLKGGGVIDFVSKLYEINAKTAAHLLACAYGISPYTAEGSRAADKVQSKNPLDKKREVSEQSEPSHPERSDQIDPTEFEEVKRKYDNLERRFEKLHTIVFSFMLEHEENCHQDYEEEIREHLVSH